MRADGSLDRLTTGGMVLGVFEHAAFAEGETTVSPGDRVVLFTDGITEATDERGDEFGDERLVDSVLRRTHAPLTELVDGIFDDVAAHAGRRMTDDATVVVLGVGDAAP
jgi:sigma-B regulation protein RsbU (phosphoserine phosphatase)